MRSLVRWVGLVLLALALPAAQAADVHGDWRGSFDYQGSSIPLTFHFMAKGDALTGTVDGFPTPSIEIHDGKVYGNSVAFWLKVDYQGTPYTLVYRGTVSQDGNSIAFNMSTQSGDWTTTLTEIGRAS